MVERAIITLAVLALLTAACGAEDDPVGLDDADASVLSATETAIPADGPCDWPMWGHGVDRTFSYPCASGINPDSVADLHRVWFANTSDVVTAAPVVNDGRLFVGDWAGRFYALDAETGVEIWTFDADVHSQVYAGQITASASITTIDGQSAVVFNGGRTVYALATESGAELWRTGLGDPDTPTEIETAPLVVGDLIVVTYDVHNGPFPAGVVALDRQSGELVWSFSPEGDGPYLGCGDVWGAASVDIERRLVFAGSGNCPSSPEGWTPYTEALFALDLATGEPVWSFQPHAPNNDDSDFAGAPILFRAGDRDLVGLGNKDAVFYVVDRDTGDLVWSTRATSDNVMGPNFSSGGFVGPSAHADGIIAGATAVADCPCMHAFDAATGDILWQQLAVGPSYAPSTEVGGVVFVGSLDFALRALDLGTGEVLWSDTLTGLVSGGVAVVGDDVFAVAGFREPGSPGPSENSGVFRYTIDPAVTASTTLPPVTTEPAAVDRRVRLVDASGRCIDEACDLSFDLKEPPADTDPRLTLRIEADPFRIVVESDGLGPPAGWIRAGSEAEAVGASAYAVMISERDDDPNGGFLCVIDADGGCVGTSVPDPGASYNRISVLAVDSVNQVPDATDGFARLVTSIAFNPPLQTEVIR
ncbi:MAG: PQQ-binding-like beta-propeller repeat protein [Acidimicrobiales bacterium]